MSDYLSQAIEAYRETVARFPNDVVAYNGLTEALKQSGRHEEALEIQRETVARFPNNPVVLISLADTLSRLDRIEESIELYREATARFPHNPVAMTGLAETLRRAAIRDPSSSPETGSPKPVAPYKYQIALSFAGEDRAIAKELAQSLTEKGVPLFFDEYEQTSLWGKDLYQHLQHVYRDSARFCVVLLSKHYAAKLWPRHELKQAQARAFEENREYILPLRIDDTEIPGISKTIGYLDVRNTPIPVVVQHILDKLAPQARAAAPAPRGSERRARVRANSFAEVSENGRRLARLTKMNLWQRIITALGVVGAIATILALTIDPSLAFGVSIGLLVISVIWVTVSWRNDVHARGDNNSAFKRWCETNIELASKYGFTKGKQTVLKVWEQFFEKGRILLSVTNNWTLVFYGELGSFMRLPNPEAIITGGPHNEIINETYLSELLLKVTDRKNRVVYEELARAQRLVGGIGTIYIRDDMLHSLGKPVGAEFRSENVLRVQGDGAELLIGIPHQIGSSFKAILLITEDGAGFSKFEWQG